jgi:hypothetical protein
MWTGDDSGSMDYVKWQLPTFTGCGFSAQAHVSGDVDGIFGGSPESYVRDLQFKALMSVVMVMSGWAENPDKQPCKFVLTRKPRAQQNHAPKKQQTLNPKPDHPLNSNQTGTYGEPYTTYNRAALKLKARLTPYMYALSREAHDTGVPPVRALLMEFPEDEALYAPTADGGATYSFMSGASLLAAPVYMQGAVTRDGIYLPNGTFWLDFWNGTVYAGGSTLDGYDAPLDKLPLFVRAGAIVPMWPDNNYFNAAPADPMYLELWPSGNSSFSLYEDDGVTRDALPPTNAFTTTPIAVAAPADYLTRGGGSVNVTISVGRAGGAGFPGALASRGWWLNIRAKLAPLQVVLTTPSGGAVVLPQAQSESQLEYEAFGWFHDESLQRGVGGVLMVKLSGMAAAEGFSVALSNGPSWPKIGTEACDSPTHHQVENQKFSWDAASQRLVVVAPGAPQCITVGADKDPESHTPAVEVQPCAPASDAAQQFVWIAASGGQQIALKADQGTCLDQDMSDSRVIAYGACGRPPRATPRLQLSLRPPNPPRRMPRHLFSGQSGVESGRARAAHCVCGERALHGSVWGCGRVIEHTATFICNVAGAGTPPTPPLTNMAGPRRGLRRGKILSHHVHRRLVEREERGVGGPALRAPLPKRHPADPRKRVHGSEHGLVVLCLHGLVQRQAVALKKVRHIVQTRLAHGANARFLQHHRLVVPRAHVMKVLEVLSPRGHEVVHGDVVRVYSGVRQRRVHVLCDDVRLVPPRKVGAGLRAVVHGAREHGAHRGKKRTPVSLLRLRGL